MGQRSMFDPSQMIDLEMDQQGHGRLHPEPCVLYGSITSFPPPNVHMVLSGPVNTTNFDVHRLPEHHDGALFFGMMQHNGIQHQHLSGNLDIANHYNPYMTSQSGTTIFPIPPNHGSLDQLPFYSDHRIIGVSTDSYGRNRHFVDGLWGSFKRKNVDGIPGNFQYCNASASSSSAVAPLNSRPLESDVTSMDAAPFSLPGYGWSDMSSVMEVGSLRSARNRSGAVVFDSALAHNTNQFTQGNYLGQPFQAVGTPWLGPNFSSNDGDIGSFNWNAAPPLPPYMHGCMEAGHMGVPGYQVSASNRSSPSFLHTPPIPQGHPNLHHPPPPMQGARDPNLDFHSQVATSSHRLSANSTSHTSMNHFQDSVEAGSRFVGHVPSTGLRIYCPHRREAMLEANSRQHILPHLRVLPEDGVAMLEIPTYHEVRDSVDHHRNMRLDIDNMSYEELLALGEQIGSVGTGLSEETIISYLKTRTFVSSTTCSNRDEAACVDQEIDFCVICQTNFMNQEKIGALDCEHEYHADCVKKWLLVKNTCPICKSSALTTEKKNL